MPAIAFDYPEELLALRDALSSFIKAEIIPRHEENAALLEDPFKKFTPEGAIAPAVLKLIQEVRMASAKAGFYAMSAPVEIGGGGLGYLAYFVGWEHIFRTCGTRYWLAHHVISHWAKGPSPVFKSISPFIRDAVVPGLVSGEHSMCFALSETGAGSDAAMIKTRAEFDGTSWRISGTKIWITNAPYAQYAVVFAITDPELAAKRKGGISAFMVPTDADGFHIERLIKMWGHAGTDEALLRFEQVRVEKHQILGQLHEGFKVAMLGVGLGRMYNSARSIGLARWGLSQAIEYAKIRQTFGKKLADYQGVMFPLSESATQIHAGHLMALNAAQLLDKGFPATKELAMTKAFTVEAATVALDRVIQCHGAMGFTNEMYLTDAYIQVRKVNVADGSNEIMRHVIGKQLLNGDLDL